MKPSGRLPDPNQTCFEPFFLTLQLNVLKTDLYRPVEPVKPDVRSLVITKLRE
ncbi:hypothetical protein Hanom_Chr12g01107261 [Helianthus anomalus]